NYVNFERADVAGGPLVSKFSVSATGNVLAAGTINGLTITNNGTNTLNIAAGKTLAVNNSLTFNGTDATTFTFPSTTGGTVITSNAPSQTIAPAQTSGTVLGISDATALTGAIIGQEIALTGTGAENQTGLRILLSGATGGSLNAIVVNDGSSNTFVLSKAGVVTAGTWNGSTITVPYGGTGQISLTTDGVVLGNGVNPVTVTAAGAANTVFRVGGGGGTPAFGSLDLAQNATVGSSILGLTNGGTNANLTAVNGGIVYSDNTSLQISAAGTANDVLISNGAAAPSFTAQSNLNVGQLDSLDSTDFLRSTASDTFEGIDSRTLTIQSLLTGGNRATDLLNVTQANDLTNAGSGNLLNITQLDTDSSGTPLAITNAGIGPALTVSNGTSVNASLSASGVFTLGNSQVATGSLIFANGYTGNTGVTTFRAGKQGNLDINY